jgi:translation elongation factor EF-G
VVPWDALNIFFLVSWQHIDAGKTTVSERMLFFSDFMRTVRNRHVA